MKRAVVILLVAAFLVSLAGFVVAELRPAVKVMVGRLSIMQGIITGFALSDFDKVKTKADSLAAEAKKAGDAADPGPRKDFTLKLAAAASSLSEAAAKGDAGLAVSKYGEVVAACYACHSKLRDPKEVK